jgi:hypothetical protein
LIDTTFSISSDRGFKTAGSEAASGRLEIDAVEITEPTAANA